MAESPDYRKQPSRTLEGNGNAKAAWEHFHLDLALEDVEDAYSTLATIPARTLDPDIREELLKAQLQEAELLGFWLAWHRAGGFANLEAAGWNRATIFRRIRRFRANYGAHPDDYKPDWITLDLHRTWADRLKNRLQAARAIQAGAEPPDDPTP